MVLHDPESQRERLVKLLKTVPKTMGEITNERGDHWGAIVSNSIIANHLLSSGVIVPNCKVGDKVYFIKPYLWDWEKSTHDWNPGKYYEPIPDVLLRNPECKLTDIFEGIVCALMYDGLNMDYFINKKHGGQEWISAHKCFLTEAEAKRALKEDFK